MSDKVYGFCDAGCRRRVPTYEEYERMAAFIEVEKTTSVDGVEGYKLYPNKVYKIMLEKNAVTTGFRGLSFTVYHDFAYVNRSGSYFKHADVIDGYRELPIESIVEGVKFCINNPVKSSSQSDDIGNGATATCEMLIGSGIHEVTVDGSLPLGWTQGKVEPIFSSSNILRASDMHVFVSGSPKVYQVTYGEVVVRGEDGADGKDGASAYEVAVENGFEGQEQEWLESLKGDKLYKHRVLLQQFEQSAKVFEGVLVKYNRSNEPITTVDENEILYETNVTCLADREDNPIAYAGRLFNGLNIVFKGYNEAYEAMFDTYIYMSDLIITDTVTEV